MWNGKGCGFFAYNWKLLVLLTALQLCLNGTFCGLLYNTVASFYLQSELLCLVGAFVLKQTVSNESQL